MRQVLLVIVIVFASNSALAANWFAAQRQVPYPDLFRHESEWSVAASNLQVFKFGTYYLRTAPESDLSMIFQGLKQKGLALGMEGLVLTGRDNGCGRGVEGYESGNTLQLVIDRVRRAGGKIEYLAMDEPVWFGHGYKGDNACRYSIDEIVERLVPIVRAFKTAFPSIKIGDIEPISQYTSGTINDVMDFSEKFKQATGAPLAFIHADITWQRPWRPQLTEWKQKIKAAGIEFGVIINGDPTDKTDVEWTSHALERYRTLSTTTMFAPDDYVFQSWMVRPTKVLPESEAGTLMSLVANAKNK